MAPSATSTFLFSFILGHDDELKPRLRSHEHQGLFGVASTLLSPGYPPLFHGLFGVASRLSGLFGVASTLFRLLEVASTLLGQFGVASTLFGRPASTLLGLFGKAPTHYLVDLVLLPHCWVDWGLHSRFEAGLAHLQHSEVCLGRLQHFSADLVELQSSVAGLRIPQTLPHR